MAWHRGVKVHALWTETFGSRNSWVLLTGPDLPVASGQTLWCKLYEGPPGDGFTNMFSIFVSAKERNSFVDIFIIENEPVGTPFRIKEVYGW